MSLFAYCPHPLRDQEASSRLPARLAAAGNAAVCVALAAQKGEKGASREGEERQRASPQEKQSQEDEVKKKLAADFFLEGGHESTPGSIDAVYVRISNQYC